MREVFDSIPTVLVADDERALRLLVTVSLEVLGVRVCEASNGQEAMDRVLTEKPDLIILDWEMPLISGIEILERLRAKGVSEPVILLTARAQVADRLEGYRHGVTSFMVKPFSPDELVELVAQKLGIKLLPRVE